MKKHIYNPWVAFTNSDLTEGRGREVVLGYFTHRQDAQHAAAGKGMMGMDAQVEQRTVELIIYDTYAEYMAGKREKLRKQALAKLDREEIEALGLNNK